MKKAFAVLFVLGLVSIAQADYARFELASGSTVAAGQTVTINLVSDMECYGWQLDGVAEVDALGNQTVVAYGGAASNVQFNPADSFPLAGFIDNYQGALFGGYAGLFFTPSPAGQPIMSFDYTINSLWDGSAITIAALQPGKMYTYAPGESYMIIDSYVKTGTNVAVESITLVPEPMTIGLLGLGGLLLRRKR